MWRRFFLATAFLLSLNGGEIFAQSQVHATSAVCFGDSFSTMNLFHPTKRSFAGYPGKFLFTGQSAAAASMSLPAFSSIQQAFFCRLETKIERFTSLPLRFRLGSLAYTEYLEKKPNALRP